MSCLQSSEHSAKARGNMLGRARPVWFRVLESEQRMNWLKNMVRKRLLVRDIESFLKSQEVKLRSEEEKVRDEERDILLGLMTIKLKDDRKKLTSVLIRNYDRRSYQSMDKPTYGQGHREASLPIYK